MQHFTPFTQCATIGRRWLGLLLLLFLWMPLAKAVEVTDADFKALVEKIWNDKGGNPAAGTVKSYMDDMNSEGAFKGVSYTTYKSGNYTYMNLSCLDHLTRLTVLSEAYVNPANTYYQNASVYQCIVKGLQYWYDLNTTFGMNHPKQWKFENWWNDQIGEPQRFGLIFVFMTKGKESIPSDLAEKYYTRWKNKNTCGDPDAQTGANLTDVALHRFYLGCCTKDASLLQESINYIFSPLCYTTDEGFQIDNSFFQHGQQIYIGGYGDALLAGVLPVANYVYGTAFQMSDKQLSVISKFLRETFTDVIRGKTCTYDVLGRGMSRTGALQKTSSWVNYLNQAKNIDPEHANEYTMLVQRISGAVSAGTYAPTKNTHYFRADYTLHMRPAYTFSVRMASTRTRLCEYGNGENEKGFFVGDGSTNILRTGNEYYNLMPLWNWNFIPGTTAQKMSTLPKQKNAWGALGVSTFAGGVSDSTYGATAYNYIQTGTNSTVAMNYRAKKGWFFFDDEVVCLGAGIISSYNILTTLDQCWGQSSFYIGKTDNTTLPVSGETNAMTLVDTCQYVLHNSVGYYFPQGGRVVVSNKNVTGKWSDINSTGSSTQQSGKVFTLQIDHRNPRNQLSTNLPKTKYAYIVYPNTTLTRLRHSIEAGNIEIAENSDTAQVVHHKGLGIYEMIFYRAGAFKDDSIHVEVSRPCALLFKHLGNKTLTFHVADPGQTLKDIDIKVKTAALEYMRTATARFSNAEEQLAGQTRTVTITPESEIVGIHSPKTGDKDLDINCSPRVVRPGEVFEIQTGNIAEGNVELYSLTGIKLKSEKLRGGIAEFSQSTPGIYIARVNANGQTKSIKIAIQ